MAPEHLAGAVPTPQFDVYALGICIWRMMVGRHPFEEALGDIVALMYCHESVHPESLTTTLGLPPYADDLVREATAKDPLRPLRHDVGDGAVDHDHA